MATALAVPQPKPGELSEAVWQQAACLPCRLKAEIAVRGFTLGDLLSIEAGSLVDSGVSIDADVAIAVNQAPIGCAKLDLIGDQLAVRVTELA